MKQQMAGTVRRDDSDTSRSQRGPGRLSAVGLAGLVALVGCASAVEPCDAQHAMDTFEKDLRGWYAYLHRVEFDLDAQLAQTRRLALEAPDAAAVRAVLLRTTWAFADPHLAVGPRSPNDANVFPTSSDLLVDQDADGWFVSQVRAGSAAAAAGILPLDRVETYDGQSIEAGVDGLWSGVVVARTPHQRRYAANLLVNGRRVGKRILTVRRGNERRTLTLANPRELATAVSERAPVTIIEHPDLTILRLENSLGDNRTIAAFDEAIAKVAGAPLLVVDLRNTPSGGNTDIARSIIGHFVDETRPYQRHRVPGIERKTSVPREFLEFAAPRAPRWRGPVVVIGGTWTGSMGEGLVIGLHGAAGMPSFASDMGDLLGAVHSESLGSCGATIYLGAEALFHINGTPREDYAADTPLKYSDLDPAGQDAGLAAIRAWAAQHVPGYRG